jgi:ribonuclease-3 family protein
MDDKKLKEYTPLSLAYLGDAVWELYVREYFFKENLKAADLNKKVSKYVNAKAQSLIFSALLDSLGENDLEFAKRARNTKINSFPKTCTAKEYKNATAFEALIALYHLKGEKEKIFDILEKTIEKGGVNEA